ncbi:MAG: AAA domain-containing protein [Bdellovibrionia bacterium]
MSSAKEDVREKSVRLFTYLRELTQLKSKVTLDLKDYEQVLWFSDIPRENDCFCISWGPATDETSDKWVEIKKPKRKEPPSPPEELKEWVTAKDLRDSSKEPKVRDTVSKTVIGDNASGEQVEETVIQHFAELPQLQDAWTKYLKKNWQPWASDDQSLAKVEAIYKDLFSIYQKQQKLGEAYEVVLGLGLLTWRSSPSSSIRRHILTTRITISFDTRKGAITIGPTGEGVNLELEQEMIDPQKRPDAKVWSALEQQAHEIGEQLWDGAAVEALLKSWTNSLSSDSRYEGSLTPQSSSTEHPLLHYAPAIILRKQTERSLLRMYQEIIEQLKSDGDVPLSVTRLVDIIDDAAPDSSHSEQASTSDSQEIYFPLVSNQEQKEIAERISARQGVLVQGPPGTGKSHTIANLICHLLATGHRVLVTSHTPRALKVLRDKFPKEVSALCVSLLGDDGNGMKALEDSVQGITEKYNCWNPIQNQKEIRTHGEALRKIRAEIAATQQKLRSLREAETFKHPLQFGSYSGTLARIAEQIKAEESKHNWLDDHPSSICRPPLTNKDLRTLISLSESLTNEIEDQLSMEIPASDHLPKCEEFSRMCEIEAVAKQTAANHSELRAYRLYFDLKKFSKTQRVALLDVTQKIADLITSIGKHSFPWVNKARSQILSERDRIWRELLRETKSGIKTIRKLLGELSDRSVSGLEGKDLSVVRAHAQALHTHLSLGKGLGFGPFRAKVVKEALYLVQSVRIGGRECKTAAAVETLLTWIELTETLRKLQELWKELDVSLTGNIKFQVAELEDLCEPLDTLLECLEQIRLLRAKKCLEPNWIDDSDINTFIDTFEAIEAEENYEKLELELLVLEKALKPTASKRPHPVYRALTAAVKNRDAGQYDESLSIIVSLAESKKKKSKQEELLTKLETAAPNLAARIRNKSYASDWLENISGFEEAWNWACARSWLHEMDDPDLQQSLSITLNNQKKREQEIIKNLAAAKSWEHCFSPSRMNEFRRQHLLAWSQAVRKIGKGTGKYANKHRRAAREHMEQCRGAIPAWIMPIQRVAESIKPGTDSFDVVIIDEASQSGPEALFLHYLAKKIVVVGDDKQISPESMLDREDIQALREKWINDIPFSNNIGVDDSFFDLAKIRFKGRIRLREHFRCMPEIIQFSNNLCYQSEPLIPLKQFGAGRLQPVVASIQVPGGYQEGTSGKIWNPPEVEAIVSKIQELVKDPAYEGKTLGIISLLGDTQANQIEKRLLETIGPEEIEKRELVCGDAYAFQGDERDIMLLSLVSAPSDNSRIGVLSKDKDERRFNVAASRAKEQMWLFHSATLNDVNPKCYRYKLLEYFLNPKIQRTVIDGKSIEEVRTMARNSDRAIASPPSPFDSWFELDVFFKIHDRGFRVIPQYEVAGRRIDLIIEGIKGQLAVECDGDFWHGPEKYEEDAARQRELERCNWRFWRIRESSFRLDPDGALTSLWETLESLQITPWIEQSKELAPPSPTVHTLHMPRSQEVAIDCGDKDEIDHPPQATVLGNQTEQILTESESSVLNPLHTAIVDSAKSIDAETWFQISQNGIFTPFQKRLSYTLAQRAQAGNLPSVKQSYWALEILLIAIEKGVLEKQTIEMKVGVSKVYELLEKARPEFRRSK